MKKKRILILLVVLGVFLAAVFFIFNSPARELSKSEEEAALTQILGRKPNLTDTSPKGDILYKGKLISFLYPANAKIYIPKLNGKVLPKDSIDSLIFDLTSPKIAFFMEVDTQSKSVQTVEDFPGVRLRETESNIYHKKDILVDGQKGLVFEKQDNTGLEKTAFFHKDGKVYSFSFQGADSIEVENLYSKIMASVKFLS